MPKAADKSPASPNSAPNAGASSAAGKADATPTVPAIPVDKQRELIETVAFVLVLVTMLRAFVAEAFVIPTGSMAPTLLGANRRFVCPQCDCRFAVNATAQAEDAPVDTRGGVCPNCRFPILASTSGFMDRRTGSFWSSLIGEFGDRVVVAKYNYEFRPLRRWEVAVFKYSAKEFPERNTHPSRTNFIKRIVALPGDELTLYYGDLLVRRAGDKEFTIPAKTPDVMMMTRRIVCDNDLQPKDLLSAGSTPRWTTDALVQASADRKTFAVAGDGTLSYRHLVGGGPRNDYPRELPTGADRQPQLITDFESYNRPYGVPRNASAANFGDLRLLDDPVPGSGDGVQSNWVGDLMVEATVKFAKRQGRVALQLREAARQYRCELSCADAGVQLKLFQNDKLLEEKSLAVAGDSFAIRLANFDDHLVVWLNGNTPFGDGVATSRLEPADNGPTAADLEPVQLKFHGFEGVVSNLKLYRDVYYTLATAHGDEPVTPLALVPGDVGSIESWRTGLQRTFTSVLKTVAGESDEMGRLFKVPADHYMACGDNSPRSFDSRGWSLNSFVPKEAILGRSVVVYYPLEMPPWLPKYVK